MKQLTWSLLVLGVLLTAFAASQYLLWTRVPDWETAQDLLVRDLMNYLLWFMVVYAYPAKDYLVFVLPAILALGIPLVLSAAVVGCFFLMDRLREKPQPKAMIAEEEDSSTDSPPSPKPTTSNHGSPYNLRTKRQRKFVL